MPSLGQLDAQLRQNDNPAGAAAGGLAATLGNISRLRGGENVIYYGSGFLQKPGEPTSIVHEDMNSVMNAVYGLDYGKGLFFIIHTAGGDPDAAASIAEYLQFKFPRITAVVPHLAMSAGAMLSLACDRVIMGKQSQLGPIDPQMIVGNKRHSARAIKDTFERAEEDILKDTRYGHLWAPILQHMGPSLITEAEESLKYSKHLVAKWLQARMFKGEEDAKGKAARVAEYLNAESRKDGEEIYAHGQRIDISALQAQGVKVDALEDRQDLQEEVLTAYHLMTLIFEWSRIYKLTMNQNGACRYKISPLSVAQAGK